ncbi:Selenoprotein W [Geodia barretti]|uniref:Selenoprotein W n=1 Tax=Geodia barretti TaxID=519541 RepID=A0AA35WCN4_GEOBA|nr:Selenoprotein W [Geodia barretti]
MRYRRVQEELSDEFGDKIAVLGESTKGITGSFEVTVAGKLVHSKKGGEGFVDSEAKLKKIVDAIRAAIGE